MANTTNTTGVAKQVLGTRADWQLRQPTLRPPRFGLHLLGPLAVLASTVGSWFAFAGATGDGGNVAFGLFVGAVSIILMAWSFLLAVRLRFLERFFGGLDSMYRVHAMALDVLEAHHQAGRLHLIVHASSQGNRFRPDSLSEHHPAGLAGAHVAVCGPASLVTLVETEARRLGATSVEREDFDIRQGFGPDLSRPIHDATTKKLRPTTTV